MSAGGRRAELSPTVRYLRAAASSDTLCVNWLLILGRSEHNPGISKPFRPGRVCVRFFRHQRRVQNFPDQLFPTLHRRPCTVSAYTIHIDTSAVQEHRTSTAKAFYSKPGVPGHRPADCQVELHCPPFDVQGAALGGAATLRVRCQVRGSTLGRSIKQGRGSLLQTASRVAQ